MSNIVLSKVEKSKLVSHLINQTLSQYSKYTSSKSLAFLTERYLWYDCSNEFDEYTTGQLLEVMPEFKEIEDILYSYILSEEQFNRVQKFLNILLNKLNSEEYTK